MDCGSDPGRAGVAPNQVCDCPLFSVPVPYPCPHPCPCDCPLSLSPVPPSPSQCPAPFPGQFWQPGQGFPGSLYPQLLLQDPLAAAWELCSEGPGLGRSRRAESKEPKAGSREPRAEPCFDLPLVGSPSPSKQTRAEQLKSCSPQQPQINDQGNAQGWIILEKQLIRNLELAVPDGQWDIFSFAMVTRAPVMPRVCCHSQQHRKLELQFFGGS